MIAAARRDEPSDPDERVILHGLSWWQLEAMLAIRGDQSGVRLAYLEGALELMRPSRTHEYIRTTIARLMEAYAEEEEGLVLDGLGSMTMKHAPKERAAEPDECYVVLWEWRDGKITVLSLTAYTVTPRSGALPGLDLELLARFVDTDDQTAAVRAFRKALREPK